MANINRRSFGLLGAVGLLGGLLAPKLSAETVQSKDGITEPNVQKATPSATLTKLNAVLNTHKFKHGWGFELKDKGANKDGRPGSFVEVLIYTPIGTERYGRRVLVPNELLDDEAFQTTAYIEDAINQLVWQFEEYKDMYKPTYKA